MKSIVWCAALCAVYGCAQATATTPAASTAATEVPAPTPPPGTIAIRIPDTVAQFVIIGRRDFEDEAAGVGLRYEHSPSLRADVFVYPGPDLATRCPVACARDVLAGEVTDFQMSVPGLARSGSVQQASLSFTRALTPPPGAAWQLGHHMTVAAKRDGEALRSEFYLYYVPGYRVKVRSTFVETPERLAALAAFLDALVPALVGSQRRVP